MSFSFLSFDRVFWNENVLPPVFVTATVVVATGFVAYCSQRIKPISIPLSVVALIATACFVNTLRLAKEAVHHAAAFEATSNCQRPSAANYFHECIARELTCTVLASVVTATALFSFKQLALSMISGFRH